ncbi:outer membrane protein assembly factor BamA [Helicobacter sp. 11S02629-2]|nr:outer membrane protein assembly factor BamA [Helicobacter sp. 11S02629-2]
MSKIDYKGLSYISSELASDISNIKEGSTLDEAAIDKAVVNFYNQGYFNDVYATFDKGVLTFHFKEKPSVASIEIKGWGTQSEKDTLYGQIGIKKGDTFDNTKLKNAKDVILKALEYKGFYGTVVQDEITKLSNANAVSIILNVNRGNTIVIDKSTYNGAKNLKKRTIESLSANKQRDFLGFLPGLNSGKLILNELEVDPLRIQDVYMRHGYLDAHVSTPFLEANMDNYKAKLYYNVHEGVQYKVKDVEFNLSKDVITKKELSKKLLTVKGSIFDIQNVRTDIESLKFKIADLGYAYVAITPDLKKDPKTAEVTVDFRIDVGQKVHINDVVITGNTRTGDRIIRREVLIAPGDLYSLTKITQSENALKRLGYFDKVRIDSRRVTNDLIDLVVNVSEGRTGELVFGVGYGSFYGLMVNANVNERNLFGSGFSAGIGANVSFGGQVGLLGSGLNSSLLRGLTQQNFNASLTNPRILDSKWSVSFNAYYANSLSYVYSQETIGGGFSVGRLLLPNLRLNVGYDLNRTNTYGFIDLFGNSQPLYNRYYASHDERVFPTNIPGIDSQVLHNAPDTLLNAVGIGVIRGIWDRNYVGSNAPIKSSVTPSLNFDNTDDYYFPKNGISASVSAQLAGLGGDVRYVKLYTKNAFYYDLSKLLHIDLIARYKVQAGYLLRYSQNDFFSLNDTFYMGGVGTIRGFYSYSISPNDEFGLRVGGDGIFTNSVELSYGLIPSAKMRLSLYADYGFLTYKGTNNQANFKQFGTFSGPTSLLPRGAAGAAIEWVSPMGPIVLVFPFLWYNGTSVFSYPGASKIRQNNNFLSDYPSYFEFTMGTRF